MIHQTIPCPTQASMKTATLHYSEQNERIYFLFTCGKYLDSPMNASCSVRNGANIDCKKKKRETKQLLQ